MCPGRIICMGPYGPKPTKADIRELKAQYRPSLLTVCVVDRIECNPLVVVYVIKCKSTGIASPCSS